MSLNIHLVLLYFSTVYRLELFMLNSDVAGFSSLPIYTFYYEGFPPYAFRRNRVFTSLYKSFPEVVYYDWLINPLTVKVK